MRTPVAPTRKVNRTFTRVKRLLPLLLPPVLALICWWPTLGGFFLSDDFWALGRGRGGVHEIVIPGAGWQGHHYRPLTIATFVIEAPLYGDSVLGHRLFNLLVHMVAAIVAGRIARLISGNDWAATVGGGVFAVYPLHPQAVTWVSGRADPLVGLLIGLTALMALRFYRNGRTRDLVASMATGMAACLAKETGFSVPLVVGILAFSEARSPGSPRRTWKAFVAIGLVTAACLGLRIGMLGGLGTPINSPTDGGLLQVLLRVLAALWSAFKFMAAPALGSQRGALENILAALPTIAVLGTLAVGLCRGKFTEHVRSVSCILGCALLVLLPGASSGTFQNGSRLLYAPTFFVAVAGGVLLGSCIANGKTLLQRSAILASSLVVVCWGLLLITHQQPWIQASDISRRMIERLPEVDPDIPYVVALNVPNEHNGAQLFGIAFDIAARDFAGWPKDTIVVPIVPDESEGVLTDIQQRALENVEVISWGGEEWSVAYSYGR